MANITNNQISGEKNKNGINYKPYKILIEYNNTSPDWGFYNTLEEAKETYNFCQPSKSNDGIYRVTLESRSEILYRKRSRSKPI